MKTRMLFLPVFLSALTLLKAQDAPAEAAAATTEGGEAKKSEAAAVAPAGKKAAETVRWQDKIETGGLLPDIARSKEKPRQLFSLRKPADPARDLKNVYFNPSDGRPMGFKLFSFRY